MAANDKTGETDSSADHTESQSFGRIRSFASTLFRQAAILSPWLLAIGLFKAALSSSQGISLAVGYTESQPPQSVAYAVLITSGVLLLMAGIVSFLVARTTGASENGVDACSRRPPTTVIVTECLWTSGLASSFALMLFDATLSVAALISSCILILTTVLIYFLVFRMGSRASPLMTRWVIVLRRQRIWLAVGLVIASLIPLIVCALVLIRRPLVLDFVGPLLTLCAGLVCCATLLGGLFVMVPRCLNARWLPLPWLLFALLWNLSGHPKPDGENTLLSNDRAAASRRIAADPMCRPVPVSLGRELQQRIHPVIGHPSDASVDNPTLTLVSAEGGGIRAAYWTAVGLGRMEEATNGTFSTTVVSMSGVSGGSLGIATWLAAQERSDLSPSQKVELISRFLGSDFLSPLVAGFLFLDAPRQLLGPLWFDARRDSVFEKSVADRWKLVAQTDFFYRPIFGLCMKGFGRPPAVFFNATDADSGSYVPLSETTLTYPDFRVAVHQPSSIETSLNRSSIVNISVAQATHISALFPYLSDALEVRLSRTASKLFQDRLLLYDYNHGGDLNHGNVEQLKKRAASEEVEIVTDGRSRHLASLVDGGYFDNTGLLPTQEALNFINGRRLGEARRTHAREHPYTDKRVMIVHFSNDPSFACSPLDQDWATKVDRKTKAFFDPASMPVGCEEDAKEIQTSVLAGTPNWLKAPISGLLSVRDSHSLYERQSLIYRFSNSTKETAFVSLDLATAMTEAYGQPYSYSTLNPVYPSSLFDLTPEKWHTIESSLQNRAGASGSNGSNANPSDVDIAKPTDQFSVDMWENRSHDWIKRLDCLQSLGVVDPPLGWTLNGRDKAALQCLMQLAIFRSGMVNLSEAYGTAPPKLPGGEEEADYMAVFANELAGLGADAVSANSALIQFETAEEAQQARRPEPAKGK